MAPKKAMKAMKAMKSTKAMKAMKAMKKYSPQRTMRRAVFQGLVDYTNYGLAKEDLVKNKRGRIVSKKLHEQRKGNAWISALGQARWALGLRGFQKVRKGSALYKKAKDLMIPEE